MVLSAVTYNLAKGGTVYPRIAIVVLFLCANVSAHAQNPAACGSIKSDDERYMCRALAEKNPAFCGSIKNDDKRYMCRAQASKNPTSCGSIKSNDLRAQCRALAG